MDQGIDPKAHAQEAERAHLAKLEAERIEHESRLFGDTVNQWHELALSKRKDKGKETMRIFSKDVLPHLAHKELGNVTKADLLAFFDRVTARGANVLANHILGDLRQFFNWCDARELISKHPLRGITKKDVGGAALTTLNHPNSNASISGMNSKPNGCRHGCDWVNGWMKC